MLFSHHNYLKKVIYQVWHWETWHWLIKYIPLAPAWIWYCLRSRSLWFFTAANPSLTFGGFEGENKREMYAQLPLGSYPQTFFISCLINFSKVENLFLLNTLTFPLAVKPDIGRMGLMFRKINSITELQQYHKTIKVDYLLQEFVHYPIEVSVFYYRFPNQQQGTITGFVKKEYLSVTGDGKATLWELMLSYARVSFRLDEMRRKHADKLTTIISAGEVYTLCHALNLSRGGKLVSLEHEKDERLLEVFDELSHYSKHFHFGRYDIKCASIDDLKNGKNFSILEFNGSGAEPHHVYGNGNTLLQALGILLFHWNILFKISRENYKKGIPYWSFLQGYNHLKASKKHFSLLRQSEFESSMIIPDVQTEIYTNPEINLKTKTLQHYGLTADR